MKHAVRFAVLFSLLAAAFQASPGIAATWTVPGLSNAPGRNGTFFVSELKIRNLAGAPAEATFELLPIVGGAVSPATRTIAAGETLVLSNALSELYGAGDRAGTVRVTSAATLLFSARTYNNADPKGTFGLSVDAVEDGALLTVGQTGHVGWVSDSGDGSKGFRTNVGIVLAAAGSSVDAVVFGAGGAELGRRTFTGGPQALQVAVRDIASGDLSVARLELRVTAGKATGYSAVVDNVTGDGFTVPPQRVTPGTWADVTLNGVSRGPGRFDTFFRTDVRLVNPEATARKVTVSGVSLLAGGQPFPASGTVDLPAKATVELDDVLGALLKAPDGTNGALRFQTDGPLLVLGRTSNIGADGSTFGAVQKTFGAPSYLVIGSSGTFTGLIQSTATPGYRTNVGFLAGAAGAVVDLTLHDRTGTVVSTRTGGVALAPFAFYQPSLADLFPGTTIPENAALDVTLTGGTVDVYASFIDNGTGDPAIYPITPVDAAIPPSFAETSPCPPNPGVAGLINAGTNLFRVTLDTSRYPDAVCNDGTPAVFYARKGKSASVNRWIIYLEGGGSCADYTSCAQRWCSVDSNFGAFKMSNRYLPEKGIGGGGILDDRPDSLFSDFSAVWISYCSSDSWTGRRREAVLKDDATGKSYSIAFEGGNILDAVLMELRNGVTYRDADGKTVAMPSLDDAEGVLFVGESAGGIGVKKNTDRVNAYLTATNRTGKLVYRSVIDAADHPTNPSFPLYEAQHKNGILKDAALYGARFDESCLAFHAPETWRCNDMAHLTENHVTTPFFSRTDLIDPNVADGITEPNWQFGTQLWEFGAATWDHLERLPAIRTTAEEKASITVDPGVYGPHCENHTALRDSSKFFQDKVAVGTSQLSYYDTLRNWLLGMEPKVAIQQPRPSSDPVPKSAVCSQ